MANSNIGQVEIKNSWVCLCEGSADQNFIKKLISLNTKIPKPDFLDPNHYNSRDGFGKSLSALSGTGISFSRNTKGILIVADSHDDPNKTFKHIIRQIKNVNGCPLPKSLVEISTSTNTYPPIKIILLPDEQNPGALETLLFNAMNENNNFTSCVDKFLSCGVFNAVEWPPEKLAKAKFHSTVAASHRTHPGKPASGAFEKKNNSDVLVDINCSAFSGVLKKIELFCKEIGVMT